MPGSKVTEEIARIRELRAGEYAISPNRHPEINSVEELLDVSAHLRRVSGKPVGFESVIGAYAWLEAMFEEIHRRGVDSAPDFITVDSAAGGTGAAPMALIDDMGLRSARACP